MYVKQEDIPLIQKNEIKVLENFIKIASKHNLKYFLYGGTLLGAIRHKGFIPWDDDVDVIMPRSDYEIFLKVAKEELPNNMFLQTCLTDPYYSLPYAKIRKVNTSYIEMTTRHRKKMVNGVFIDIFPLDEYPYSKLSFFDKIMPNKHFPPMKQPRK